VSAQHWIWKKGCLSEPEIQKHQLKESGSVAGEIRVPINSDQDIVLARQKGRSLAARSWFFSVDSTLIATAFELARKYCFVCQNRRNSPYNFQESRRKGILIVPPIRSRIPISPRSPRRFFHFGQLGSRPPGVRGSSTNFQIVSSIGQGTVVKVTKWRQDQHESSSRRPWIASFTPSDQVESGDLSVAQCNS